MKPSDFFLNRRHFLGFLVPGALWLASGLWICGHHPIKWLDDATFTRWAVFLVGSYLVGYVMQSVLFILLDDRQRFATEETFSAQADQGCTPVKNIRSQSAAAELQALRKRMRSLIAKHPDLSELNPHQLGQFCKRVAAKDSEFFQAVFLELEDEVNFTLGVSTPLIVLAVVGFIRSFGPAWLIVEEQVCIVAVFVLMLLLGGYIFWRFFYARAAEEEGWYRSFMVTWQGQTNADNKQSPEQGPSTSQKALDQ